MTTLNFLIFLSLTMLTSAKIDRNRAIPVQEYLRNSNFPTLIRAKLRPETRIAGGQDATDPIPYQVGLFVDTPERPDSIHCSACLIKVNYVLTAAHCMNPEINGIKMVFGAVWVLNGEEQGQVIRYGGSNDIVKHPDYDPSRFTNDIAIIKLTEPMTTSDRIWPIGLPPNNDQTYENQWARVSGWGQTSYSAGKMMSPVLRYVDVQIVSNQDCSNAYHWIQPTNLCISGADGKTPCSGDSGSPVVIDNVLIGIHSFSSDDRCELGTIRGVTRTSAYLEWIYENTP